MQLLKDRIRKDGKIKSGNVLKVDSFLNHQMDIKLFEEIGKEFKVRPQGCPSRSAVQQALNFIKSGQKPRNYAVSGVFPFQMV